MDALKQSSHRPPAPKPLKKSGASRPADLAAHLDFREIGDHVYDGIYVADGAGKTLYVNKAYTRITGIQPEEVVGFNVLDLEKLGIFKNAVTPRVLREKKQVNSIGFIPRTKQKMLVTGLPIFDDQGDVKMVVVIDREFSELSAMKEELDASREKIKSVERCARKGLREIEHLRKQQRSSGLIGDSDASRALREQIEQIANLDVTVLLVGETGVGKEVIAAEIHQRSERRNNPFIKVNCAAIPPTMLEAELFGYEKGAFTGAAPHGRIGLFELAEKGTILLDEIGDMPLGLQVKLLRVLQHKEVTRIGGRGPISLDVRIIAATNADLKDMMKEKLFREDLFYRISVFPIAIKPLRERPGDILVLAQHFLETYGAKYARNVSLSKEGASLLQRYPWPGNVRELQNVIERLVIVSDAGKKIDAEQISIMLGLDDIDLFSKKDRSLKEIVDNFERHLIEKAMEVHGSTRLAAQALKVDQSTIVKKRKKWLEE